MKLPDGMRRLGSGEKALPTAKAVGQIARAGTQSRIQSRMAQTLPESFEAQRHDLDHRHASRHFQHRVCDATTRLQNPQRHCVGKTQPATEFELPLLHALDGNGFVGGKKRKEQTRF